MEQYKYRLVDYDYRGGLDEKGVMRVLRDKEAVENALKLWIASARGDIVRYGGYGGYVLEALYKPMNDETADDILFDLEVGLINNFSPFVNIVNLEIEPNYEQKEYVIDLEIYVPDYNFNLELTGALPFLGSG